ncbi:MAG: nucleotidyltransferase domain-containing protein [Pseudomonadota bacterium]
MRLTQQEIQIIKSSVHEVMGENASVWLFGSRVDDSKRGGDIDLFVEAELYEPRDRVLKTAQLWVKLQLRLGEQRIDIILAATQFEKPKLIEQVARKTGMRL